MKFSNNYIFYPDNNELVKAIDHYKSLHIDQVAEDCTPDSRVAVQD